MSRGGTGPDLQFQRVALSCLLKLDGRGQRSKGGSPLGGSGRHARGEGWQLGWGQGPRPPPRHACFETGGMGTQSVCSVLRRGPVFSSWKGVVAAGAEGVANRPRFGRGRLRLLWTCPVALTTSQCAATPRGDQAPRSHQHGRSLGGRGRSPCCEAKAAGSCVSITCLHGAKAPPDQGAARSNLTVLMSPPTCDTFPRASDRSPGHSVRGSG